MSEDDLVKIKKQSNESEGLCCRSDGDYYPWGTEINFEDEMVEELGMESLAVGDIVEVRGYAFVDRKAESSSTNHGSSKSVGLQLTSLKIHRDSSDRAEKLYGSDA